MRMGERSLPPLDVERGTYAMAPPLPPPPQQYIYPPPPKPWFPWLVPVFFIANIVMFAYTMYINDCPRTTGTADHAYIQDWPSTTGADHCVFYSYLGRFSFQPLRENPLLGPSTATLKKLGALDWYQVVQRKEGWRLLSCIWLHAGAIHLISNMLSLIFIGIRLEQEFGFVKIGVLYVLAGFGGSLLSALGIQTKISVGASGALFGLLGGMLSELITNWTIYANKCAALSTLVIVIALNLAVGLLPNVDSSAHIGGFISGFLLGFVLLIRPQFGYVSRKNIPPGYDIFMAWLSYTVVRCWIPDITLSSWYQPAQSSHSLYI